LNNIEAPAGIIAGAAADFEWRVAQLSSLGELARWAPGRQVAAVLFNPHDLPLLTEPVREILHAAPGSRAIACSRPPASISGAYTNLLLPLSQPELHQALGFVWAAERPLPFSLGPTLVRHAA
jgi:hypothetical protein